MINTSNWTCDIMYNKVFTVQLENIFKHRKFKNICDLVGMHGYKRWNEYRMFKEFYENAKTERYYINTHHKMIEDDYKKDDTQIDRIYNVNAFDIPIDKKKSIISSMFSEWRAWEHEYRELLAACVKWCIENNYSDQEIFQKLLCKSNEELKYIDRHIMKLKNIQYNFDYITCLQDEIHDKYKCKTDDLKVEFK